MPMKTIKMSDQLHAELTAIVGEITAESGQKKSYEDAIEALLHRSIVLPPEVVLGITEFIRKNPQLGFPTKEEFLRDASRWKMDQLARTNRRTEAQSKTQVVVCRGE